MQVIATRISKVDPAEVDEADFLPLPTAEIERLVGRLREMIHTISDAPLRTLAECFLIDNSFMTKLTTAPAGTKNHHAYRGGLLAHIVNVMEIVLRVSPCYPQIDRDLLLMGAFLHDTGKTTELNCDHGLSYTDEGQLLGHMVMAIGILDAKAAEAQKLAGEPIPEETMLRLKHMIVSHHGEYAFGSPKLPMTLEAVALSYLDNLDAKINTCWQLISEDPNVDSAWTVYHPNLDRKLFKGKRGSDEG